MTFMNLELIERLVRFQQPEKVLPYLGELDETRIAALFGLDHAAYRSLCQGFDDQTRQVAATLLTDAGIAEQVDRLPFAPGQHVVAIGESTTADRLSWFEILRHLLTQRRPADAIAFTNLAISGCTSTQALTQLPGLPFSRPDWVLCMLGANDAQRLGPDGSPTLVSAAETERNLFTLRDLVTRRTSARWVWLTPATVDEKRVTAYPHFQRAQIGWTNADIDSIAEFLCTQPEPILDTRTVTAAQNGSELHLDDGVHLSLAGQRAIAVALTQTLAAHP
jgi:lysophospholipase L1-like esterase